MRKKVNLECDFCHKPFKRLAKRYNYNLSKNSELKQFCSPKCSKDYKQRDTKEVKCGNCEKITKKKGSELRGSKSGKVFCDHSCSAIYSNTHKTTGCRRSKLEIYLEEQINLSYPELGCVYNGKELITSELDFYFPTLKLAIELNGIFHYEPIYGTDKLERIRNNDKQKMILCEEKGIELCVIDSSHHVRTTQKIKDKFWVIFDELIKQVYGRHKENQDGE